MPDKTPNGNIDAFLIGACGFYCGSCPSYGSGSCTGCRTSQKAGDCFTLACVTKNGLTYCGECERFPCDDLFNHKKATLLDKQWLLWKRRQRDQKRNSRKETDT